MSDHTIKRISREYTLSRILRDEAKERGLTQRVVAKRMGCSAPYVCDMFNGRRDIPPLALNKMMAAVGIEDAKRRQMLHRLGAQEAGWEIHAALAIKEKA